MKRVGELKEEMFNGKIRWGKSKTKPTAQNVIPLAAFPYICAPGLARAAHFENSLTPVTAVSTDTREALPAREGRFHISYITQSRKQAHNRHCLTEHKAYCQLHSLICWTRRHGFHNTSQPITNTVKGEAHSSVASSSARLTVK